MRCATTRLVSTSLMPSHERSRRYALFQTGLGPLKQLCGKRSPKLVLPRPISDRTRTGTPFFSTALCALVRTLDQACDNVSVKVKKKCKAWDLCPAHRRIPPPCLDSATQQPCLLFQLELCGHTYARTPWDPVADRFEVQRRRRVNPVLAQPRRCTTVSPAYLPAGQQTRRTSTSA